MNPTPEHRVRGNPLEFGIELLDPQDLFERLPRAVKRLVKTLGLIKGG